MRHLSAFFLATARPAVFVWGLLGVGVVWILTYATNDPDFPGAPGDAVFAGAFGYPAMAGVLAGLVVQELHHCWFAWTLPGVRWKSGLGFAAGGLLFTLLVVLLLSTAETNHGAWSLLAVGFSAYCIGGVLVVPRVPAATIAGLALILAVWLFSARFGAFSAAHEGLAAAVAVSIAAPCLFYRFRTATVRQLPFLPAAELAGSFTTEHIARTERDKLVRKGPRSRRWREGFLGTDLLSWLRAGLYESFGPSRPRDLWALQGPFAWLALMVGLHAGQVREGGSWFAGFIETTYHALFMPPHLPPFTGDKAPYDVTAIVVAAAGLIFLIKGPRVFDSRRPYPLSRRDLARVTYWHSATLTLFYFLVATVSLFALGLAAGWGAGFELRFDFMPLFLRAALVTVILLPIPQWIALRMGGRLVQNAFAGLLVGLLVFVAVVAFWSLGAASRPLAPVTELFVLLALVGLSQVLFRRKVGEYFATADLV